MTWTNDTLRAVWAGAVDLEGRDPLRPWWERGPVYGYEGLEGQGWVRRSPDRPTSGIVDEHHCRGYDPIYMEPDEDDEDDDSGDRYVEGCRGCCHTRSVHAPGLSIGHQEAGAMTVPELMARIDREDPLPPPKPAIGQRWFAANGASSMLTDIGVIDGAISHMQLGASTSMFSAACPMLWPPPAAVCVDQRGRCWAPVEVMDGLGADDG